MKISKQLVLTAVLFSGTIFMALTFTFTYNNTYDEQYYVGCGGGTIPISSLGTGLDAGGPCIASGPYYAKKKVVIPFYVSTAITLTAAGLLALNAYGLKSSKAKPKSKNKLLSRTKK